MISIMVWLAAAVGVAIVVRMAWRAWAHRGAPGGAACTASPPPRLERPVCPGSSNDLTAGRAAGRDRGAVRTKEQRATRRAQSCVQLSLEAVTVAPGCQARAAIAHAELQEKVVWPVLPAKGAARRLC